MKRSQLLVLVAFACLLATAPSATVVQAAPPQPGDDGTARTYWLLLDPSRPVEVTLPPLLKALARLRAAGVVLDFDQTPQSGALQVTAVPGAAAKLRRLLGVVGLSSTAPGSVSALSGEVRILATGTITGVVTAEDDGTPLAGINVHTYSADYEGDTVTDSNGTYTIDGLGTGSYRLGFWDDNGAYAHNYYHDKPDWETADPVVVTDGAVTPNINVTLSLAGHITGAVTAAESGDPLVGINVYTPDANRGGSALTNEDGVYDIGGLSTGSYRVDFYADSDTYIEEYYDDQPTRETADMVAVTVGITTPHIDAVLSLPGHITGVVTIEGSGVPLSGISVCADTDDGQEWSNCADTDDYGIYDIDGLGSGGYAVNFVDYDGRYASEYYNNRPDKDTANLVAVTASQMTRNINAALTVRGGIAGVVTAENGGALLGGIEVCAYSNDLDWSGDPSCATTGGNGTYNIGGLDSGSYRVWFGDTGPTYVMEYYNDSPSWEESNSVAVTGGITTSAINAALARPGHITGTVSASGSGTPLTGIHVCASIGVPDYEQSYCANTGSGGVYDVGGLPGGLYRVAFYGNDTYATEYYNDRPAEKEGKWVAVTAGSSTPNINAALSAAGGHITGTVTAAGNGEPLADIEACADDDIRGGCATTDSNGAYDIAGLSAGSYKVRFVNEDEYGDWGDYARQYYNGQSWETADPVVVTAGHTTPNINAALSLGGRITGQVVGEDHWPLDEVDVCVHDGVAPEGYCTLAGGDGSYDIGGLPAGTYHIEFYGWGMLYSGECYDDKSCDTPDWIAVAAGSTVANIDAELSEVGRITGAVTAEGSGAPLTGIEVCVDGWNCALTDGDGLYELYDGLGAHSYKVEFTDPRGVYAGEFYNNKPNSSSADPVAVVGGRTTRNINAALAAGGHITGTVTRRGPGTPLFNIKVTLYRSNGAGWDEVGVTYTDSTGRYNIALPSGTYRVKFEDWWWGEYAERYYWNGFTPGDVTSVHLTAPATVPNIDVTFDVSVEPGVQTYLPIIRK